MNRILFVLVGLLVSQAAAAAPAAEQQQLLDTVHGFYGWVLREGQATEKLQPRITPRAGSTRLFLDLSTLPAFTSRLMDSGYFAPAFPAAVKRYYAKEKTKLEARTTAEFRQMASDGRGPLMDTEDMNIYFCAQEYEGTPGFVQSLRLQSAKVSGAQAVAVVVSPLGWPTRFRFAKLGERWLIAGYCVYQ